jgi:hypothetical protein
LRQQEFLIYLSDDDRIRVRISVERNEPVDMMVQLECWIDQSWEQVRRYDTSHGYLHLHTEPWSEERDRREPVRGGLKEALTRIIAEFKANWERHRSACEAALRERR